MPVLARLAREGSLFNYEWGLPVKRQLSSSTSTVRFGGLLRWTEFLLTFKQ